MAGMVNQDLTSIVQPTAWLYARTISYADIPSREDNEIPDEQPLRPLPMCIQDQYRHQSHKRPSAAQDLVFVAR